MRAGIVGNIGKRCPGLNGIKILSRDPRESIGESVLLSSFFMPFSGLHIMIVKRLRLGKQEIFSCKKSVCEVSENTKNSGNRE